MIIRSCLILVVFDLTPLQTLRIQIWKTLIAPCNHLVKLIMSGYFIHDCGVVGLCKVSRPGSAEVDSIVAGWIWSYLDEGEIIYLFWDLAKLSWSACRCSNLWTVWAGCPRVPWRWFCASWSSGWAIERDTIFGRPSFEGGRQSWGWEDLSC